MSVKKVITTFHQILEKNQRKEDRVQQGKDHITHMTYTQPWGRGVLYKAYRNTMRKQYKIDITQNKTIYTAVLNLLNGVYNTVYNVKGISDAFQKSGFKVIPPGTQRFTGNEISVRSLGSAGIFRVTFYKSYTRGQNVGSGGKGFYLEYSLVANNRLLQRAVRLLHQLVVDKIGKSFGPKGSGTANPNVIGKSRIDTSVQGRLHGHPIPTGMGLGKEDTTVALVDFILAIRELEASDKDLKAILQEHNLDVDVINDIFEKLDLEYTINGFSFSDMVKMTKEIEIFVMVGRTAEQNALMGKADYSRRGVKNPRKGINAVLNQVAKELINKYKDPDKEASKPPRKRAQEVVPALVATQIAKEVRYGKKKNFAKTKTEQKREKTSGVLKKQPKKKNTRLKANVARIEGMKAGNRGKPRQASPIALKNLINRALHDTIREKMRSPRLVYRTGRFARSARVENIYMGSRGAITADYTYMKNPYQTFEPGFNMGSTFRDPRSVISASIREIAMREMGLKFGQVRRI